MRSTSSPWLENQNLFSAFLWWSCIFLAKEPFKNSTSLSKMEIIFKPTFKREYSHWTCNIWSWFYNPAPYSDTLFLKINLKYKLTQPYQKKTVSSHIWNFKNKLNGIRKQNFLFHLNEFSMSFTGYKDGKPLYLPEAEEKPKGEEISFSET